MSSNFKKFTWSATAVLVATVMSLGLMAQPASATVTLTTALTWAAGIALPTEAQLNDGTAVAGTMTSNTAAGVAAATQLVLTESGGAQIGAGTLIFNMPAGFALDDVGTCTVGANPGTLACVPTLNTSGTILTWTIAGASAGVSTLTSGGLELRVRGNAVGAAGAITLDPASTSLAAGGFLGLLPGSAVGSVGASASYTGAAAAPYTVNLSLTSTTLGCGTTNPVTTINATNLPADGSTSYALCAAVRDSRGAPVSGTPVTFTTSTGVVSTGTAKTTVAFTNAAGNASTNYRGAGGAAVTDTAIASSTLLNSVGTLSIGLIAASGTIASKLVAGVPDSLAIGQQVTGASAVLPTRFGTHAYVQVQDATGLGVDGQVVLITVDRGGIVDGIATTCLNNAITARSISVATQNEVQGANGSQLAGTITFTVCANQGDAAGKINITAQNISTAMATSTTSLTMAARPAKIDATAIGSTVTAKVSDAAGNPAADGTPVRFTISATAGAVSSACSVTSNGAATSIVALNNPTGTVIVSSDWNETTSASGCGALTATNWTAVRNDGAAGSQAISAAVSLPGGAAPVAPATVGAATVSGTVPATGFGLIVASGKITDVVTAVKCAGTSSALYATVGGEFVAYVPGTTIAAVNAAFLAAFKDGVLPASTALIGKCS